MREVYFLNHGDSIDKVKYEYKNQNLKISDEKLYGYRFIDLTGGDDDITIVKNYLPYYLYRVSRNETLLDIMAQGYNVENISDIKENDLLVLTKPKSIRYVVRPLQSIEDIAKDVGVTAEYIKESNNLNTDKLFVGQILWL